MCNAADQTLFKEDWGRDIVSAYVASSTPSSRRIRALSQHRQEKFPESSLIIIRVYSYASIGTSMEFGQWMMPPTVVCRVTSCTAMDDKSDIMARYLLMVAAPPNSGQWNMTNGVRIIGTKTRQKPFSKIHPHTRITSHVKMNGLTPWLA